MVLGVGDVQPAACISQALRAAERRGARRTAVAGIALLASAGDVVNGGRVGRDPVDRIPFPQGKE